MTTQTKSRGFTIVELLIVIVIIAILAAITIVAYNGITNRANTSSAASAANAVIKKAGAYNADDQGGNSSFPATFSVMTAATATSKTFYLTGVTLATATIAAKPSAPATVDYTVCGSAAGIKVGYWDYSAGSRKEYTAGDVSGTCTLQTT
jgi:prepilin-type N-terminal cleavage/methylation domain-containing protein